jgi:Electron transfer DM13
MNLKHLMVGAIATMFTLTIACGRNNAATQRTDAATPSSVISNGQVAQTTPGGAMGGDHGGAMGSPSATPAAQSGQFVTVEHATQGTAQIVTENSKRYLVLDQAFMTSEGPDLFVLLHREKMPHTYDAQSYISLGALQQVKGAQRYAIPDDLNLADFQSAVIWCRQFSATFAYAPIQ